MGGRAREEIESFDEWYAASAPRLAAALSVATGDPDRSADAVAEAFTRAWERWRRVRALENRDGWAYRVALNVLRRGWRRTAMERHEVARWAERPVDGPASAADVWRALGSLPARQREAIALRYVAGFTQHEVAASMGIADGTAAATLSQARARLAELLVEQEVEP